MDYYEVTSPVMKFDFLQKLLGIANTLNFPIEMMDIKGAYLNSDINKGIYMNQPDGFDDGSGCVLKLNGHSMDSRKWEGLGTNGSMIC